MIRLLIFSTLVLLFGLVGRAENPNKRPHLLVFKESIRQHIRRLPVYGKIIFLEKGQNFKALDALPRQTALFLINVQFSMHDLLKPMTMGELRAVGYSGDQTFLERLHAIWGQQTRPAFIDEMNDLEHRLIEERMTAVFDQLEIPLVERAAILEDLSMLELVSDVLDTKWHRGAELGFEYHLYDASRNLAGRKKIQAADLARWYESKYYPRQSTGARVCRAAHR